MCTKTCEPTGLLNVLCIIVNLPTRVFNAAVGIGSCTLTAYFRLPSNCLSIITEGKALKALQE